MCLVCGAGPSRLLLALAAEAELRWVCWGLLQRQLSTVSFDFGDYAAQRFACYNTYKGSMRRHCVQPPAQATSRQPEGEPSAEGPPMKQALVL